MELDSFFLQLEDFLSDTGVSKNALAAMANVPQSQVSNWSNKRGKRFTRNARKVMDAIESYRMQGLTPIPSDIEKKVRSIISLSPSNADLVRDVLDALQRNMH